MKKCSFCLAALLASAFALAGNFSCQEAINLESQLNAYQYSPENYQAPALQKLLQNDQNNYAIITDICNSIPAQYDHNACIVGSYSFHNEASGLAVIMAENHYVPTYAYIANEDKSVLLTLVKEFYQAKCQA